MSSLNFSSLGDLLWCPLHPRHKLVEHGSCNEWSWSQGRLKWGVDFCLSASSWLLHTGMKFHRGFRNGAAFPRFLAGKLGKLDIQIRSTHIHINYNLLFINRTIPIQNHSKFRSAKCLLLTTQPWHHKNAIPVKMGSSGVLVGPVFNGTDSAKHHLRFMEQNPNHITCAKNYKPTRPSNAQALL